MDSTELHRQAIQLLNEMTEEIMPKDRQSEENLDFLIKSLPQIEERATKLESDSLLDQLYDELELTREIEAKVKGAFQHIKEGCDFEKQNTMELLDEWFNQLIDESNNF